MVHYRLGRLDQLRKLEPRWSEGVLLGASLPMRSRIHKVKQGVAESSAIRRLSADRRWPASDVIHVPWQPGSRREDLASIAGIPTTEDEGVAVEEPEAGLGQSHTEVEPRGLRLPWVRIAVPRVRGAIPASSAAVPLRGFRARVEARLQEAEEGQRRKRESDLRHNSKLEILQKSDACVCWMIIL